MSAMPGAKKNVFFLSPPQGKGQGAGHAIQSSDAKQ